MEKKGRYASALETGDLSLHASWENARTRIDLCLSKNTSADKIVFMVMYGSRDLIRMEKFKS